MARLHRIQADFSGGEISSRLQSRTDVVAYDRSALSLTNCYPYAHGGVRRRPGTVFVDELKNSAQEAKLIPFVYSRTASYVLVLNGGKIQFLKDFAFIESSPGVRYELTIPYTAAQLPEVRFAQSGATLYLAHPSYRPKRLTRISDTNWQLTDIDFTYRAVTDVYFESDYINFTILKDPNSTDAFAVGDKFEIDTDGSGGISIGPTFTGTGTPGEMADVLIHDNQDSGSGFIWRIECARVFDDRSEWTVTRDPGGPDELSPQVMWSDEAGWPMSVCFFEQRLFFAGTTQDPQNIWGSKINSFFNFTAGARADDGIRAVVASNSYDEIVHLEAARQLLPLTHASEMAMIGGPEGIAPAAILVTSQTQHGSCDIKPVRVGEEVLFVQRDLKKVRAISYSFNENVNIAPDVTIFAEHITGTGLRDMAFAPTPDWTVWATRIDGNLVSLQRRTELDVTAWAKHTTNGTFENLTVIPEGSGDSTYFVTKRTIDGSTKRFIEYFDYDNEIYTDCSLTVTSGSPTDTFAGFDHLEGETVSVVADGLVHADVVVTSGSITLTDDYSKVKVGLSYETEIQMLHPEFTLRDGTAQGRPLSINKVVLRFQDTIGAQVEGYDVPFRNENDPLDEPLTPFSGDKTVSLAGKGWQYPQSLTIKQVLPMPFELLGVITRFSVNDGA